MTDFHDLFRKRALAACLTLAVLAPGLPASAQTDGAELYSRNCASCHGVSLQGTGLGPALSRDTYRYGGSQGDLLRIITNGMASQGMPAFGPTLSEEEVAAIAAFLPAREGEPEESEPRNFDDRKDGRTAQSLDYAIRVEVIADGLQTPWALAFLDADTAIVTERTGRLRLMKNGVISEKPVSGTPAVFVHSHEWNQGGLLDVAIDADYAENGWVYLSYSHQLPDSGTEGEALAMTRVVRGRIRDPLRDPRWVDQEVLFEADPATYTETFWHYGGRMVIDGEARLHFSVGDRGAHELAREPGRPTGKVHRIGTDGAIPADNPFRGQDGALPSVFSRGHRNPQGMTIEPATGRIWATEHGPRGGDELNIVTRGGDYGWPVASYGINYDGTILTPDTRASGIEQPVYYWRPSIGVSGLTFYHGNEFPLWEGKLLVTALGMRDLRLFTIDDDRVQHEEILFEAEGRPYEPVVGPDGAIYLVTDDPGRLLRLTAGEERKL
jgi:glucose/arabinose dehydrogenase